MHIYQATGCHFISSICLRCLNMSQSGKPVKKGKADSFVRRNEEVLCLLKVAKTSENVDWESNQTKNFDILALFVVQYLSPEERAFGILIYFIAAFCIT